MSFNEKRILITGAAGFIGSNLTDKLLEEGAKIIGIDNLFSGNLENLEIAFFSLSFKKPNILSFYKGL